VVGRVVVVVNGCKGFAGLRVIAVMGVGRLGRYNAARVAIMPRRGCPFVEKQLQNKVLPR